MRVARHGADEASHAVSLYSVTENAGGKFAWLTMKPVTGRTHQLRAHAAHIGHPIIGDDKYFTAEDEWNFPGGLQNKLHLHARRIVIPHPSGKGVIDVSAPLPPHMQQSWNLMGFDASRGDAPDEDEESSAPAPRTGPSASGSGPDHPARRREPDLVAMHVRRERRADHVDDPAAGRLVRLAEDRGRADRAG